MVQDPVKVNVTFLFNLVIYNKFDMFEFSVL